AACRRGVCGELARTRAAARRVAGRSAPQAERRTGAGGMTPGELKTLDFVRERIAATGMAPTIAEIGEHLGWAGKGSVHSLVASLIAQGLLLHQPCKARGLSLPGAPDLRHVDT